MNFYNKLKRFVQHHGINGLYLKILGVLKYNLNNLVNKRDYEKELQIILEENPGGKVMIFISPVPWNLPLYQRPHHLAKELAELGFIYFYCTNDPVKDKINGFKKIFSNCYLTNQQELLLNLKDSKIIQFYSTDMRNLGPIYKKAISNNDIILYEYIDELHSDITGEIPNYVYENHKKFLIDEKNCHIVASADKLLDEVKNFRSINYKLVTNGVDKNHFVKKINRISIPKEIQSLIKKEKPIIGYFGAFAAWFDYELVKELAVKRPQYEILLIGWDYDKSIYKYELNKIPNITILGPVEYNILPQYAIHFDVSTIPFKINEVTESTSPVKLFEYMAMGKPIVTTNMKECRKYNSVIIAEERNNFILKIDEALSLKNDDSYLSSMEKEALNNTWSKKAAVIKEVLKK